MDLAERYPKLFRVIDDKEATGVFQVLDTAPPFELVSRVYVVAAVGDEYLYVLRPDGSPNMPGGMLLPGEMPRHALARELRALAGTEAGTADVFGGWHLHEKSPAPIASHLPHPETWRLVYHAGIDAVAPRRPGDDMRTELHVAPLDEVITVFRTGEREDLAELYWLIHEKRHGIV